MKRVALAALGVAGLAALAAVVPSTASRAAPRPCPREPDLGSVAVVRGATVEVVDFATCRTRTVRAAGGRVELASDGSVRFVAPSPGLRSPNGQLAATIRVTSKAGKPRDAIWITGPNVRAHEIFSGPVTGDTTGLDSPGPIELLGWSGDSRWLVFTIDPGSSGSIAADGLIPRIVSAAGGAVHRLPVMLTNEDYLAWCGGRLVVTAGEGRVVTDRKRLLVASPPAWHARELVHAPGRAWGSLACAPDGRSLVAQSQPQSTNGGFFASRWSLWRVGLDGSLARLTSPPRGSTDESPRYSRDGRTLMFVRSRHGFGGLYVLRGGKLSGPILGLGTQLGFYGQRDWWQRMDWSLGLRPSL